MGREGTQVRGRRRTVASEAHERPTIRAQLAAQDLAKGAERSTERRLTVLARQTTEAHGAVELGRSWRHFPML